MNKQNEYHAQCEVIQWKDSYVSVWPELFGLFAVPNGLRLSIGTAVKAKKQGLKKGVADLFLSVPRGGYHGLYIEMKDFGEKLKPEQEAWKSFVLGQGYYHVTCYGSLQAIQELKNYLQLKNHQD